MFGLFKKKPDASNTNQYSGKKFGHFVFKIPEDWNCIDDNGTLRAGLDNNIRLNISIRDVSQVMEFNTDSYFETVKAGYYDSDINWGAYSDITKKDDFIYQTLEYGEDPRLILAVAVKNRDNKKYAITISFAGNSGKDIDPHLTTFIALLENIETLH